MKHTILRKGNTRDAAAIASALEAKLGIKLMAQKEDDAVHGYVNVLGDIIEVVLYDQDEAPNTMHKTTFTKLNTAPTKAQIEAAL